jgi:alkanesulfonate monooxygenase SsuD/methylene tetrahydromethanopterin reductase-like flavin-dependent oxidoreductase (luciferase family)
VDLGAHLPVMQLGEEPLSRERLERTVDAARECGLAAVSVNDHLVFQTPWLDSLTALASVAGRAGDMELATTLALVVVRGPAQLAKALAALDILCEGRLIAGVGPGSSERDYDLAGVPFHERWKRLDAAIAALREHLAGLEPGPRRPEGIPIWIGSWGSKAGLARVKRSGDGWLASAYNTTPDRFAEARAQLPPDMPNALATMWTWVTEDRAEADRVIHETLAPMLRRDPAELSGQVCVGSAEHCAGLLERYAEAGCERAYLWPLGDEARQIELIAGDVAPLIATRDG